MVETGKKEHYKVLSTVSGKSSVESTLAYKAGLRTINIEREDPVIIMPLDSSSHSSYCLMFYVKFLYKPGDMIHVCYVAQNFYRKLNRSSTTSFAPSLARDSSGRKLDKTGCFASLVRFLTYKPKMVTIMDTMGPSPGMVKEMERDDKSNCNTVKEEVKDVFLSNGVKKWDFQRITGEDPWTAIIDFCEYQKGTMIILGSRSLSKVKRNLLGSVSTKVLHGASVPVMVIKRPPGNITNVTRGVSTID